MQSQKCFYFNYVLWAGGGDVYMISGRLLFFCPIGATRVASVARLRLHRSPFSGRACNNAAEIGTRVKPSESVWPESRRVRESCSFLRCEISIYIV